LAGAGGEAGGPREQGHGRQGERPCGRAAWGRAGMGDGTRAPTDGGMGTASQHESAGLDSLAPGARRAAEGPGRGAARPRFQGAGSRFGRGAAGGRLPRAFAWSSQGVVLEGRRDHAQAHGWGFQRRAAQERAAARRAAAAGAHRTAPGWSASTLCGEGGRAPAGLSGERGQVGRPDWERARAQARGARPQANTVAATSAPWPSPTSPRASPRQLAAAALCARHSAWVMRALLLW
jgi:hypothetical protein